MKLAGITILILLVSSGHTGIGSDGKEVSVQQLNALTDNSHMVIKKQRQIKSTTKAVWTILTEPAEIKKWLGVEANSEWTPQSDITFTFTWEGQEYVDKGKIIRFDDEKSFIYTYWSGFSGLPDEPGNYSKIEFLLEPTDKGVSLKLTHSGFATETIYKHSDKNWEETMDVIKKLSEEKNLNHNE